MADEAVAEYPAEIKQLGDQFVQLTVLQARQLSDYLEEVHGIKAATGGVVVAPAAPADAAPEPEKTEFDVVLESSGGNKISVIKVVRAATGLGLKEAKAVVDEAPKPVKQAISKEDAEKLKKELEEAGATVTIK